MSVRCSSFSPNATACEFLQRPANDSEVIAREGVESEHDADSGSQASPHRKCRLEDLGQLRSESAIWC